MSSLKSILKVLCGSEGVKGAIMITKDGMVIETNLDPKFDAETLAAFMSQIYVTITNSLAGLGQKEFTRYVMQSNQAKIFLMDLGKSALITITDVDTDQGKVNVAFFQAANEIKKTGRIDV
ncbi:MAG: roadblock/LC7 domain-containing protein [Nitrospinae bacterium]|nr:roadblock/LC7 domain-containing protein [Nitrospinota bacterium]